MQKIAPRSKVWFYSFSVSMAINEDTTLRAMAHVRFKEGLVAIATLLFILSFFSIYSYIHNQIPIFFIVLPGVPSRK